MGTRKPVILLVAEAVTLAHFGRIATLAKALASSAYEIAVASDPRYIGLEPSLERAFHPIRSIPSAEFARALAQGKPLYSVETLTRYVEDDLTLLDKLKPDLVIGDFRLSLAVSAPLREIPYAAVVNAYWSPFASTHYPVPDLPMTRIVGVRLAQKLFDTVRPIAFARHARQLWAAASRTRSQKCVHLGRLHLICRPPRNGADLQSASQPSLSRSCALVNPYSAARVVGSPTR